MSNYVTINNTWRPMYYLSYKKLKEKYEPRVTIPLNQWQQYVSDGYNTLYGGAIIPGGTENTGFSQGGAVYKGHVSQDWGGWN